MFVWSVLCILASVRDAAERVVSNRFLALMALVALCPRGFCLLAHPGPFAAAVAPASRMAAAALTVLLGGAFARLSKGGLGMGDVKLIAVWALLLGARVAYGLALACAAAAVWAFVCRRRTFAFAPWICAACWACLVYTCW